MCFHFDKYRAKITNYNKGFSRNCMQVQTVRTLEQNLTYVSCNQILFQNSNPEALFDHNVNSQNKWYDGHNSKTKIRLPCNRTQNHPQMHAFSYECSLLLTWPRLRLHHLICRTKTPNIVIRGSVWHTTTRRVFKVKRSKVKVTRTSNTLTMTTKHQNSVINGCLSCKLYISFYHVV